MHASLPSERLTVEGDAAPWRPGGAGNQPARFRAARLVLGSALCAAPLALGSVEPWAWPVLTLLSLGALAFWGVACIRQGYVRIHWSGLYGLGAFLLALGLLQLFGHVAADRVATRDALILLATDLILFFLAGQLFACESPHAYRQFGGFVTIYAAALGLLAIFQSLSSHGLIYWSVRPAAGAVFGPYINRNDYAGLMEMLIPVAAAYAFTRRAGDPRRLLSLFAVVVAVASLLLCGSRGGMVALLAEIIIFAGLSFRLKYLARWQYWAIGGALIAGIALSVWTNPARIGVKIESVASFPMAPEVTLGQRLAVTRDTLRMVRDHPWLGAGMGDFMNVFPRYQSFAGNAVWQHAHDDYVEALAETGLAGGLLLLAGLLIFLRTAFGKPDERLHFPDGWVQLACGLGCCGLLVHSFVDFNLHIPANAAWFAVCLGVATAPPLGRRHRFDFV
ncbi:MAG TPA: O-antigen ligase family protein [Candidatus Dormibacteraeota bacterium]|nr:O-antigen ligase family protein [Candidatus Dormibacteraeota bacterium]